MKRYVKKLLDRIKADIVRMKIISCYKNGNINDYIKEAEYVQKHKAGFLPYDFVEEYKQKEIAVYFDKLKQLPYVKHKNNRLYFPQNMKTEKILAMYKGLLAEQDERSPHHYFDENENIIDSVFCDCGAAEGIIALNVIEKCKKVYLLECDLKWEKALLATFEPWKDKVSIINKYVGNLDNEDTISLNTLLKEEDNIIIKMDIEGAEVAALAAAEEILRDRKKKINLAVCTYHKEDDFEKIGKFLEGFDLTISVTEGGVLWLLESKLNWPYFRKCVIKAKR